MLKIKGKFKFSVMWSSMKRGVFKGENERDCILESSKIEFIVSVGFVKRDEEKVSKEEKEDKENQMT